MCGNFTARRRARQAGSGEPGERQLTRPASQPRTSKVDARPSGSSRGDECEASTKSRDQVGPVMAQIVNAPLTVALEELTTDTQESQRRRGAGVGLLVAGCLRVGRAPSPGECHGSARDREQGAHDQCDESSRQMTQTEVSHRGAPFSPLPGSGS